MERGKHTDSLPVVGLVIHYRGMVVCDVANGSITQPNLQQCQVAIPLKFYFAA